jgi:hypothetical protein
MREERNDGIGRRITENIFPIVVTVMLTALIGYATWTISKIYAGEMAVSECKAETDKKVGELQLDIIERLVGLEENQKNITKTLERMEQLIEKNSKVVSQ